MRMWMSSCLVAFVVAVATPAVTAAHEGHAHRVMGTVSSIDGTRLTIKTTDSRTVVVVLDSKTKIVQGKTKVTADTLKIGDRIVAEGAEVEKRIMAASLQIGVAAAAKQ